VVDRLSKLEGPVTNEARLSAILEYIKPGLSNFNLLVVVGTPIGTLALYQNDLKSFFTGRPSRNLLKFYAMFSTTCYRKGKEEVKVDAPNLLTNFYHNNGDEHYILFEYHDEKLKIVIDDDSSAVHQTSNIFKTIDYVFKYHYNNNGRTPDIMSFNSVKNDVEYQVFFRLLSIYCDNNTSVIFPFMTSIYPDSVEPSQKNGKQRSSNEEDELRSKEKKTYTSSAARKEDEKPINIPKHPKDKSTPAEYFDWFDTNHLNRINQEVVDRLSKLEGPVTNEARLSAILEYIKPGLSNSNLLLMLGTPIGTFKLYKNDLKSFFTGRPSRNLFKFYAMFSRKCYQVGKEEVKAIPPTFIPCWLEYNQQMYNDGIFEESIIAVYRESEESKPVATLAVRLSTYPDVLQASSIFKTIDRFNNYHYTNNGTTPKRYPSHLNPNVFTYEIFFRLLSIYCDNNTSEIFPFMISIYSDSDIVEPSQEYAVQRSSNEEYELKSKEAETDNLSANEKEGHSFSDTAVQHKTQTKAPVQVVDKELLKPLKIQDEEDELQPKENKNDNLSESEMMDKEAKLQPKEVEADNLSAVEEQKDINTDSDEKQGHKTSPKSASKVVEEPKKNELPVNLKSDDETNEENNTKPDGSKKHRSEACNEEKLTTKKDGSKDLEKSSKRRTKRKIEQTYSDPNNTKEQDPSTTAKKETKVTEKQ